MNAENRLTIFGPIPQSILAKEQIEDAKKWLKTRGAKKRFETAVFAHAMFLVLNGVTEEDALEIVRQAQEEKPSRKKIRERLNLLDQAINLWPKKKGEAILDLARTARLAAERPSFASFSIRQEVIAQGILPQFKPDEAEKLIVFSKKLIEDWKEI